MSGKGHSLAVPPGKTARPKTSALRKPFPKTGPRGGGLHFQPLSMVLLLLWSGTRAFCFSCKGRALIDKKPHKPSSIRPEPTCCLKLSGSKERGHSLSLSVGFDRNKLSSSQSWTLGHSFVWLSKVLEDYMSSSCPLAGGWGLLRVAFSNRRTQKAHRFGNRYLVNCFRCPSLLVNVPPSSTDCGLNTYAVSWRTAILGWAYPPAANISKRIP